MKSIKTKITLAFIVVIAIMIMIMATIVIVNFSLLNKYKIINENIVYEQELKDKILLLIEESYKSFNANDYSVYNTKLIEIRSIENNLDIRFSGPDMNSETKLSYRSVKNSLNTVIDEIEKIKNYQNKEGGISYLTTSFQDSMNKFEFVKSNISDLLIIETKNIARVTQEINKKQTLIIFLVSLSMLFATVFLLMFAFIFSKKITRPIIALSEAASRISRGDLSMIINKELLERKDELGSLSKSFNSMVLKLREKIIAYEISNKELDIKVKEVSDNNLELEKNKTVIVNLLEDFENEKKNAEGLVVVRTKELNDEKARLLASINSLQIGFAIIDKRGEFIINIPSLLSILDINEDFVSLDHISEHLKIKGASLFSRLSKCTKDKCIVEISEIVFNKKYLKLFLNPVFSLENVPIGGVLLLEDITEAKILERSRDEFFAVASHELRTPLTAIRGNSEMILEDYKDKIKNKEVISMLGDINEASVRLISIVNDFLEVSRLEQGNIILKNTNFDILEVANKTIATLQNEAESKGIALEIVNPSVALPTIFADKERVEQIMINLIGNSIKFTDKGSIKTSFEVLDKLIKVRITDTGKGILAKNENLLFRKFQPAGEDMLARDVTKSTGLGLYISKIIIEQMGGTIGLEKSTQGKGSVFFFTIPTTS